VIANLRSPQSLCPSVNNSPDHTVHDADPLRAALRFELPAGPNWFSAGMYAVHGYRTAETAMVVAGPCRLLAHAHPEDRAAFAKAWRRMQGGAGPVTLRYRVVGADGVTRPVYVAASLESRPDGTATVYGVIERDTTRATTRLSGRPPKSTTHQSLRSPGTR